jgi:hypothetical protein
MKPWERRAREREDGEERGALELITESSSRERDSSSGRSPQNLRGIERQTESESITNREESSRENVGADARARH